MTAYDTFLAKKRRRHGEHGQPCTATDINPILHEEEVSRPTLLDGL